ncbi:MAG: aldo/keto reductase [Candidatus Dadabacteria bacterium]|nr:aldo/keto reductase [Candidatus Dadabacteria bacterium]
MKYRELGSTGIKVSEIGFGSWAIGGAGYGPTDDTESKKALHRALELGVNFIDTADSYGNGHSEMLIGDVLESRGDKNTTVCTKFGWDFYSESGIQSNLEEKYINFAVKQSLHRLKRDNIDIYLIHSSDPKKIKESDVINTLKFLKKEGIIKFFGISINDYYYDKILPCLEQFNPDVVEVRLNLLDRIDKSGLFDLCNKTRTGVIIREPLANGLLSGKYTKNSIFSKNDHRNGFSKGYLEQQLNNVELLREYFGSNGSMICGSIKYTLGSESVSVVIPGAKTIRQVEENICALDYDFDFDKYEKFKKENLI